MIAQFKQNLYNRNICLQDQGKVDQIDTLQNRHKFWPKNIDMGGPIADNLYDYDWNDDGLWDSVRGAVMFPEIRELKRLLDILRYKWPRNQSNFFINEMYSKPPKKVHPTNKTDVFHVDDIWSLGTLDLKDYGSENNRG